MPRLTANLAAPWQSSQRLDAPTRGSTPAAQRLDNARLAVWSSPVALDAAQIAAWGVAAATDRNAVARWGLYSRLAQTAVSPWGIATATDRAAASPWGQYLGRLSRAALAPWGIATAMDRAASSPWGQYLARLAMPAAIPWGISTVADAPAVSPWGRYTTRPGIVVVAPTEDGAATLIIPIQRSYIVQNDVTLTRVSDSLELPALTLQLSIDADSWVWGFSASLPGSALDDVVGAAGSPVELAATINGIVFRLLAERVARSRSFGKSDISISGRGIAAALDAPYAALASYYSAPAITAQQAAEAAITSLAAPAGWSLDWQITDWLLPAGLWSHQGSPISAVNRIAAAAGAYVQADPLAKVLHVLPRYPIAPWAWAAATPDYEIPSAVAVTEAIEWQDKPVYDVVYVSGQAGGVLGRVLRTGEAGTLPAQMVTDNLITHTDAARQRGLSILADTGRQTRVSLSMPILPLSGIIQPGALVEYVDGATTRLGLARSIQISASLPTVRQTVEIETHE